MAVSMKPCDMNCTKCGAADVHRIFREKGDDWRIELYGDINNRFAKSMGFWAKSLCDHIQHKCRVCSYEWRTSPMRSKRTP